MGLLSKKAKNNLCQLATYLQSLPPDYKHFFMNHWFSGKDEKGYWKGQKQVFECGTSACLAGHGPAAGIGMPLDSKGYRIYDWSGYARMELLDFSSCRNWDDREKLDKVYNFLFTSHWESDHYDGAARIRSVLDHDGFPKNGVWKKYRVNEQVPLEKKEPVAA